MDKVFRPSKTCFVDNIGKAPVRHDVFVRSRETKLMHNRNPLRKIKGRSVSLKSSKPLWYSVLYRVIQ